MDILIPNSWLKKFLDTKATPSEIAKYLSLCGPSIEKVTQTNDGDSIYSVEVTTNRMDTASVIGIAREASSILPRFGIKARFIARRSSLNPHFTKNVKYLDVKVDEKLCPRFTAVLIKNVTVKDSPKEIKTLLEKVGVRPINNLVDVSNYIMHELGQPVHTFDYDKIVDHKMILRESKKNEKLTTLDGKDFKLPGGDIVIEDGSGKLIDLCGIMGGENSAIDTNTKNVLLFVQTYNQHNIRKTSMTLAQRSEAAVLFEKGLDPENVAPSMLSAIEMIKKLSGGAAEKEVLDVYKNPYKQKFVNTTLEALEKIIGIKLNKKDVSSYLESLGFNALWSSNNLRVGVPSYRSQDVDIPEDLAEEVARIYGYHNLPNVLMAGNLPQAKDNSSFKIEDEIKLILKSLGAQEVLNLSLIDKGRAGNSAIRLKNSLGSDTEYLRTSLKPYLIENIKNNAFEKNKIHLFELSNIYLARKNDLPEERLTLSGIIKNDEYRKNTGVVATLLNELQIDYQTKVDDQNGYLPGQEISVYSEKIKIGEYGNLEEGYFYYEFEIEKLLNAKRLDRKFKEVSKFPPQIEDITFELPERTYTGSVINTIKSIGHANAINRLVSKVELKDRFNNSYTFRVEYQDPSKTLTDHEVEQIRNKILAKVKEKLGGQVKE